MPPTRQAREEPMRPGFLFLGAVLKLLSSCRPADPPATTSAVATTGEIWEVVSGDIATAAEQVSEAEAAARMVTLFGQKHTALYALVGNAMHDDEHYGNIVTYMRMGMVPPSSAG